jgi:hypothetical protein
VASIYPNLSSNAIGYAKFYSRSHNAVIRVCGEAGNVIETHEHAGEFKLTSVDFNGGSADWKFLRARTDPIPLPKCRMIRQNSLDV